MASVNKVILIGNLGRDPETRYATRKQLAEAVAAEREACLRVGTYLDAESFGILPARAVQVIMAYQDAIRARNTTEGGE